MITTKGKKTLSFDQLNTVKVPVTALRFAIAKLSQDGYTEYPLGDLLLLIYGITVEHLKEKEDDRQV